jgi:hypothetical protein
VIPNLPTSLFSFRLVLLARNLVCLNALGGCDYGIIVWRNWCLILEKYEGRGGLGLAGRI